MIVRARSLRFNAISQEAIASAAGPPGSPENNEEDAAELAPELLAA
jgi:hypothetical protein